jgi:hypothetical protein
MVPQNPDPDCVAQRGTAVLNARGASSAASAANAAIDHFCYADQWPLGFDGYRNQWRLWALFLCSCLAAVSSSRPAPTCG